MYVPCIFLRLSFRSERSEVYNANLQQEKNMFTIQAMRNDVLAIHHIHGMLLKWEQYFSLHLKQILI